MRNLEREIASVCRARRGARSPRARRKQHEIVTPDDVDEFLGPAEVHSRGRGAHRRSRASRPASPGRRPAATSSSSRRRKMPGKGELTLTGQLGDVMKESAQAALSFMRARAPSGSGIERELPREDATSTSTSRRARSRRTARRRASRWSRRSSSLLTGMPVRRDVAMTGEITLRGHVLPVGGIKEKVLAAHRAGIKRVIIPGAQREGPRRRARGSEERDGDHDVRADGRGPRARAEGSAAVDPRPREGRPVRRPSARLRPVGDWSRSPVRTVIRDSSPTVARGAPQGPRSLDRGSQRPFTRPKAR